MIILWLNAPLQRNSILTEVELAYFVSEAPIIGITGSNGRQPQRQ